MGLTLRQVGAAIGVSDAWNSPIYQWGRGGRQTRPLFRYVVPLADVLESTPEEVIARLWGEEVGGPCDCDRCGGVKILPTNPSGWKLDTERACAGCGKTTVYYRNQGLPPHHELCMSCSRRKPHLQLTCPDCGKSREIGVGAFESQRDQGGYANAEIDWSTNRGSARCGPCAARATQNARIAKLRKQGVDPKKKRPSGRDVLRGWSRDALLARNRALAEAATETTTLASVASTEELEATGAQFMRDVVQPASVEARSGRPLSPAHRLNLGLSKLELRTAEIYRTCFLCGGLTSTYAATGLPGNVHRECWDDWRRGKPDTFRSYPGRGRGALHEPENLMRAREMVVRHRRGDTIADLAERFSISEQRVKTVISDFLELLRLAGDHGGLRVQRLRRLLLS